jgi:hypothetical protein
VLLRQRQNTEPPYAQAASKSSGTQAVSISGLVSGQSLSVVKQCQVESLLHTHAIGGATHPVPVATAAQLSPRAHETDPPDPVSPPLASVPPTAVVPPVLLDPPLPPEPALPPLPPLELPPLPPVLLDPPLPPVLAPLPPVAIIDESPPLPVVPALPPEELGVGRALRSSLLLPHAAKPPIKPKETEAQVR